MKLIDDFPLGELDFLFSIPTVFASFGFFAMAGDPKFYCTVTTLQGIDPTFTCYEVQREEIMDGTTVLWNKFPCLFLSETEQGLCIAVELTAMTEKFYKSLIEINKQSLLMQ